MKVVSLGLSNWFESLPLSHFGVAAPATGSFLDVLDRWGKGDLGIFVGHGLFPFHVAAGRLLICRRPLPRLSMHLAIEKIGHRR